MKKLFTAEKPLDRLSQVEGDVYLVNRCHVDNYHWGFPETLLSHEARVITCGHTSMWPSLPMVSTLVNSTK